VSKETYMDGSTVRQTIIYLSGPMTGIPEFNGPAFKHYAEKYRALGFKVVSPFEMDEGDHGKPYRHYLCRDMAALLGPEGVSRIYMLPSWEKSRGARLELHAAGAVGIAAYDAETGEEMENPYVL